MAENIPNFDPNLPIRVNERLVKPIVTYGLLGITLALYLAQVLTERFMGFDLPAAYGMKINEYILQGEYWRLLTPALLHGSLPHIAFNMYALYMIGGEIEKRFGHARFALLYLVGAFGGNVLSFLLSPNPSLGASTAIFGLLGAEIVFFYQNRKIFGRSSNRALQNAVSVAVVNLIIGLSPGIDNWGHLGGLIAGLIFTALAGPLLNLQGAWPLFNVVDQREKVSMVWATLANAILFLAALRFKL